MASRPPSMRSHSDGQVLSLPKLCAQRVQRSDVDLREGREGLDGVAQDVERHPCADGERRLLHPFALFGTERIRTCESLAVTEQRQEPKALLVCAGIRLRLREVTNRHHRAEG